MGNGDSDNVQDAWEVLQQAAVALWDKFDQYNPSWPKRVGLLSKKPIGSLHKTPRHEVPTANSRGCQPTDPMRKIVKPHSGDTKERDLLKNIFQLRYEEAAPPGWVLKFRKLIMRDIILNAAVVPPF